jgi:hypothetical protein
MTTATGELRIPRFRVTRHFTEPDALIDEARQRQRRRQARGLFAGLLAIAGTAAVYWALAGGAVTNSTANGAVRSAGGAPGVVSSACSLLANSQVAQVLGGRVTAQELSSSGGVRRCAWAGPTWHGVLGVPVQTVLYVSVFKQPLAGFERAAKAEAHNAISADGSSYSLPGNSVPVRGLGSSAYYYPRGTGSLRAWQNGYVLELQPAIAVVSLPVLRGLAATALKHI